MLLGVDVGGTFTDAVLFDGSTVATAKVPSTPHDQSEGVLAAVDEVLAQARAEPRAVDSFAHGMTVGTNALLEERGARTALIATEGFADLLEIGRQQRPSLYRLCEARPAPLVTRELRFEAPERIGPGEVVRELSAPQARALAARVHEADPESVAVCLLFGYRDPAHEQLLAGAVREAMPGIHVSVSHEVLPRFREVERCSTTVIDAYLSPLLDRYLGRLVDAAAARGLPEPLVMRSSGGVAPAAEAARAGAWSVLSGPAGGAVGAGLLARLSGDGNAVGLDMGGTSCDVCVIEEGRVRRTDGLEVGGRVLQLPAVDVHTVGAGGGSIGWADAGGALRVGPRSAGADPGPACYGRGGREPTVTDANLCLGRLPAGGEVAGGVALNLELAERALSVLGQSLGLSALETAEGIVRVANLEMTRALRVVTVERGVDPRRFALLPFGGAGPLHAAALAEELEMGRVLCPRAGGVLSALGLVASDRRRDTARTVLLSGGELTAERLAREVGELVEREGAGLEGAEPEVGFALRYRGQAFELEIGGSLEPEPEDLRERFAHAHAERYGYDDPEAEVELVDVRVAMVVPGARPELTAVAEAALERSRRRVRIDGEWLEAEIVRGEPAAGLAVEGPAVLELPSSTLLLPPGWQASVDGHGTLACERGAS